MIIWGAHQGVDQVGIFSHENEVEMTRKYRKEHDLMGFEAEDLISELDNINEQDIVQYKYPDDKEIERIGVRGIYLNNYIRWDSKTQHEEMIKLYDYETSIQTRTFDTYNDVDCFNYSDVHDYIKYIKHGYGKVTDHACREIRLRRMTREQGIEMVKKYINKKPINLELFLNWIGITENSFHFLMDQHRNKNIWYRNDNWDWQIKSDSQIYNHKQDEYSNKMSSLELVETWSEFIINGPKKSTDRSNSYILVGRGAL